MKYIELRTAVQQLYQIAKFCQKIGYEGKVVFNNGSIYFEIHEVLRVYWNTMSFDSTFALLSHTGYNRWCGVGFYNDNAKLQAAIKNLIHSKFDQHKFEYTIEEVIMEDGRVIANDDTDTNLYVQNIIQAIKMREAQVDDDVAY